MKGNCNLLKEAIDYRAINLYLRMGQVAEESRESTISPFAL